MVVGKLKPGSSDPFASLGEQLATPPAVVAKKLSANPELLKKPKAGVTDVPASPLSPKTAEATGATKLPSPFKSFMTIDSYDVTIQRPDGSAEVARVSALRGKGDNCTMVVPVILGEDGTPSLLVKDGNTRAAHELRQPGTYVRKGMVGGRWDKDIGADPAGIAKKIGIAELAEEIGARAVKGGAFVLGENLMPTLPGLSTEADLPVGVVAAFVPGDKITGDQSGMEVVGLMKPQLLSVPEAFAEARSGAISEGPRFEAYARRCLDKFGFIPELNAYVFDLPPQLKAAFKANGTLGLGAAVDPRKLVASGEFESAGEVAHAAGGAPKPSVKVDVSQINGVEFVETKRVDVEGFGMMFDAKTDHVVKDGKGAHRAEMTHPNQLLHVEHDLAKVAVYYDDPVQGPMVRLSDVERPVAAAKHLAIGDEVAYKKEVTTLVRRDLPEVRVDLPYDGAKTPEEIMKKAAGFDLPKLAKDAVTGALQKAHIDAEVSPLFSAGFATPGGTDVQHHFFAAKLKSAPSSSEGFVRLSEALRIIRGGEGDPAAESGLLRLASVLGWVPSLGMSLKTAKLHVDKFADE